MTELCELFFNKWVKYIYLIMWVISAFLILWALCTVAGTTWALNIPYNFSGVVKCESDAFLHTILPVEETCRNAYYFSLFLFALIVVVLSALDLKEQAVVQMLLGFMRFLMIAAILVYSIIRIAQNENICITNTLAFDNENTNFNLSSTIDVGDIVFKFDPKGWVVSVPVIVYAAAVHPTIPSLTHPIRQKKYLYHAIVIFFCIMSACYFSLGVVTPLLFKADIQQTVTLNFVSPPFNIFAFSSNNTNFFFGRLS